MTMKSSLILAALLLTATSACAQDHHHGSAMGSAPSYWSNGYGGGGYGGGLGSTSGSRSRGRLAYEAPRQFEVGVAKNDGPFVPSTYMNYDDALALGRQQLAAAEESASGGAATSLGEAARAYRIVKVPTMRLQSRATQDNSGRLVVCNLNGNDCHQPM
jgi:hypothetical protein